jgi:hypothetical protein
MATFAESIKSTYTTMFMVPCIGIDRAKLKEQGFMDGYLDDISREIQFKNAIYMLFKPTDYGSFNQFTEAERERGNSLVDDYDYEGGYTVLVYVIEDKWLPDYQLFLESKYSRFSEAFKQLFPPTVKIDAGGGREVNAKSIQYRVVYRDDDLKAYWEDKMGIIMTDDIELLPALSMDKEVLDIDELKQKHE